MVASPKLTGAGGVWALWQKCGESKNTRDFGRGTLTQTLTGVIFPAPGGPTPPLVG